MKRCNRKSWLPMAMLLCVALCSTARPADNDFKVNKLEQDVLELRRQLQVQQRQIEELQRQPGQARGTPSAPAPATGSPRPSTDVSQNWLDAANWDRIKPGMAELEVVRILGVPNSLRSGAAGARQTLLYAIEVGTGSFLTGSVTLEARRVVEIQKPTFR